MRTDNGITDVSSAGTAVQIKNTKDRVLWIKFSAPAGNSGVTYVGESDVSSSNGYPLGAAGDVDAQLELDFRPGSVSADTFYVDAASSGDDVGWVMILQ